MKINHFKRIGLVGMLLVFVLAVTFSGCTNSQSNTAAPSSVAPAQSDENIVNIGATDALGTLNPLLQDGGELNKYATGLLFLPLVDLDKDLNFVGVLADSVTTEDNVTFTVKLREDAVWSDGTPITADDVVFTVLRLTSAQVGNTTIANYASLAGFSDDGLSPDGADSVEGVVKVDDRTIEFIAKERMTMETFQNSYLRYLFPIPKHILGDVPADQLATHEFFSTPTVVSGPYMLTDFNKDHYISYTANAAYFMGAPKIEKLNIKIVQGSQLYAGLQSGEIDFIQQTMGVIPQEDYESVQALENVNTVLEQPLPNQLVFFNTNTISDARVRKAILHAMNRTQIVSDLLGGNGEVVDGILTSYSPFFDEQLQPVPFDLEEAQRLLQEAGWDASREINFLVNGGDTTLVQTGSILSATLAQIGVKVNITTVDMNTLFSNVMAGDFDMYAIQYTIPPVDPSRDIEWLVGEGNYLGYSNPEVNDLLASIQQTSNIEEAKKIYSRIHAIIQEDVPLFSAYVLRALGASSKRLVHAQPHMYGSFLNVHEWELAS